MITKVNVYCARENAYYYYYYFHIHKNVTAVFWVLQHLRPNRFVRSHVYRNNELLIGRCQKTTIKFDKQKHKTTGINGNDKFLYQPTSFLFLPTVLKMRFILREKSAQNLLVNEKHINRFARKQL